MTTEITGIRHTLDRGTTVPLTLILTPDGSPGPLHSWLAERQAPSVRCALMTVDNLPT